MIKANELRISNYVEYKHLNNDVLYGYDTVTSIDLNGISLSCRKYTVMTIDCIKPIPLTEELLLKCGFISWSFKRSYISIKKDTNLYTLVYDLIKSECYLDLDFTFMTLDNEIKYLHQLQNLYFALTGTELEIKL